MFPEGYEVEQVIDELSGLLLCAYTGMYRLVDFDVTLKPDYNLANLPDTITSTTTTSPYSTEKLELIMKTVEKLQGALTSLSIASR